MRPFRSIPLALLVLALAAPVAASDLSERADAAARQQMESQKLVGLAIGLIKDGELVHLGGYGYADRDAGIEVDPRKTMFRWASISGTSTHGPTTPICHAMRSTQSVTAAGWHPS